MREASARGVPRAMYWMGLWQSDGQLEGVKQDTLAGLQLLRGAADLRDPLAIVHCYRNGIGCAVDRPRAFHICKTIPRSPAVVTMLAEFVMEGCQGLGTTHQGLEMLDRVNSFYLAAYVQADILCYGTMDGVSADCRKALALFEIAAQSGYLPAMVKYCRPARKHPEKMEFAIQLCERAARSNYPLAMYEHGKRLLNGDGVPKQFDLGVHYLRRAAASGHLNSERELARRGITPSLRIFVPEE